MAKQTRKRLSDETKAEIIADFKTGKYTQRELSTKHKVSLGAVSSYTKGLKCENEHFVNAIVSAKTELNAFEMNAVFNTADRLVKDTEMIYSVTRKLIHKADAMSELVESPNDIHTLISAVDKASVTLNVNQRHAKTEINNTANASSNTITIRRREIKSQSDVVGLG
ncbi:hypothetical protein CFT13S00388_07950 [Campylobacter fetus subsp. testudinum]|uniref:hypothetical protein n=1 Tax=Campylobacter fetus TaxID=196 RepID=UPI000818C0B7|nr:hypothetical protein [Campylobacter fetus]OCR86679.1 hypothetical protein CFT13S00388_07950 [Campylobacter fetus subsp. testudinum]